MEEDAIDRRINNATAVLSEHFTNFVVIAEIEGGGHAWSYSNRTWARGAMQSEIERMATQDFLRTRGE